MYNAINAIQIFVFIYLRFAVGQIGNLSYGLAVTFSYANNAFFLNAP